jgi:Uncharacterized protein, putative amidase
MTKARLGEYTTSELEMLLRETDITAVLATGSCEQHGPHLPLDTDTFLAEQVALEACRRSGDILLPAIPVGYNEKELDFAGTVSVPARVFLDTVVGVGKSLERSGWSRLVIVNGHGWNNDLVRAATHMLNESGGLHVACCSYWNLCANEIRELRESPVPGGMAHACEFETSLMMHLRPSSVRVDAIDDEISYLRLSHLHHDLIEKSAMFMPLRFRALSRSGVMGQPSRATAEKGRIWFEAATGGLNAFLQDFRTAYPRQVRGERREFSTVGEPGSGGVG